MATQTPQVNYANYPLKDIPQPHPHDVLCGRGGGTNNHIGNSHWRMLVAANKQLYITLPKRQKMLLSRSIVNAVRSQNPPGRFLQKDSKSNKWFDVGDQRAQEKTSQALREGAPDIRKKVTSHADNTPSKSDVESTDGSTETPGDKEKKSADDEKQSEKKEADDESSSTAKKEDAAPKPPSPVPSPATSNTTPTPQAPPVPSPSPHPQQPQTPVGLPAHSGMMQRPFMGHPNMVQNGHYPVNGGMHFPQQGMPAGAQQGQPMVYYPGPNMAPMQLYPTMVLNEQGMMVPAFSVMPPQMQAMQQGMQNMMPPQQHNTPHVSASHQNDDFEPIPHTVNGGNNNQNILNFDEMMAGPLDGGLEPAGLSFGSEMMTDAEMMKLQSIGTSFGSAMSYKPTGQYPTAASGYNNQLPQTNIHAGDDQVPQALDGLEPTGVSFGDVSMMSVGTKKLEEVGCSFGTMMSYNTIKPPDGGLEAIGTSLGSLSLDTTNRDTLFHTLELAAGGPEIPPMFNTEEKATGNLLECSDTESEDSQSKYEIHAQKSAAWEKMQSSIQLQSQKSKGTVGSSELMPPPVGRPHGGEVFDMKGSILSVPTTNLDRDFSNVSAWSAADEFPEDDDAAPPPPPQQLVKQGSDSDDNLDMFYLQQMAQKEGHI